MARPIVTQPEVRQGDPFVVTAASSRGARERILNVVRDGLDQLTVDDAVALRRELRQLADSQLPRATRKASA